MKNIAILTDNSPTVVGGSELWTGIIRNILLQAGNSVDLFTSDLLPLKQRGKLQAPIALANLVQSSASKYDLIIGAPHYCAELNHPNVIAFFHDNYLNYAEKSKGSGDDKKYSERIEQWKLQEKAAHKHRVMTCSESCKEELETILISVEKVINNAVDPKIFYPENKRKEGYIYPSRFAYFEKGFDIIKELGLMGIPITCYTDAIFQFGSAKSNPFLSRDLLAEKYRESSALVFPTRYEGGALITLEALASGIPVITTNTGYGKEILREFPEFICSSHSPKEFNDKLLNLKNKDYSKKVVEFVQDKFPYSKFVKEISSLPID